jgi:hypothetical protein
MIYTCILCGRPTTKRKYIHCRPCAMKFRVNPDSTTQYVGQVLTTKTVTSRYKSRMPDTGLPRNCRECPNLRPSGVTGAAGWTCTVMRGVQDNCMVMALQEKREEAARWQGKGDARCSSKTL